MSREPASAKTHTLIYEVLGSYENKVTTTYTNYTNTLIKNIKKYRVPFYTFVYLNLVSILYRFCHAEFEAAKTRFGDQLGTKSITTIFHFFIPSL